MQDEYAGTFFQIGILSKEIEKIFDGCGFNSL